MMDYPQPGKPRSFEEIRTWLYGLVTAINAEIEVHEQRNYRFLLEAISDYIGPLPMDLNNPQTLQFHIRNEQQLSFEHYLRSVKYQLAIERYHVEHTNPILTDSDRQRALVIFRSLERTIRNYLSSLADVRCKIHPYMDGWAQEIGIRSESDVANAQALYNQEIQCRQDHETQFSALWNNPLD